MIVIVYAEFIPFCVLVMVAPEVSALMDSTSLVDSEKYTFVRLI